MQNSQHRRPISLGLAAASLAPVALLAVQGGQALGLSFFQSTAFKVWTITSILIVLLFGTPIVLLLKRFGQLSWLAVIGASIGAANVLAQLFVASMLGSIRADRLFDPHVFRDASLLGLVAGLGFCLAAWPNNSFKVTPDGAPQFNR